MAEEVTVNIEEKDEARDLLQQLNDELALADHYRYKNKLLLENLPSFKKDKADKLADDYRAAIAAINQKAAENMREESYLMTDFSRVVGEFNDLLLNLDRTMKVLRKQVGADE